MKTIIILFVCLVMFGCNKCDKGGLHNFGNWRQTDAVEYFNDGHNITIAIQYKICKKCNYMEVKKLK